MALDFFRKWFPSQIYPFTNIAVQLLSSTWFVSVSTFIELQMRLDEMEAQLWAATIAGLNQNLCEGVRIQGSIKPGLHSFTMPFFKADAFVLSLFSLINSACHQMLPWNNAIEVIVSRTMKVYTGDIRVDVSSSDVPSSSMWTGRKTRSALETNISSHCC